VKLKRIVLALTVAALVYTGAALDASAQRKATPRPTEQSAPKKVTNRPEDEIKSGDARSTLPKVKEDPNAAHYIYEFQQPDFFVYFMHIEHDEKGHGTIRFERRSDTEQITDPLELSSAALERIRAHWTALRFLDSTANYQSERQYPHLGKTRLTLKQGGRERTVEFNYSQDSDAQGLANEYRRAADQAVFVFDIKVALESQPLETPKLINRLESLIDRDYLSDKQQLIPLLRELSEDERVPLVGRNQATRILKKLDKQAQ
jgi:uncharacterized protein (UPF0147 family)